MNIETLEIRHIGKTTLKKLVDIIIKENLNENDTIFLNTYNFDDLILDFRETMGVPMLFPYLISNVLIRESEEVKVPHSNIGILRNDFESIRKTQYQVEIENVYRCGFCGNIVNEQGIELFGAKRNDAVDYLNNTYKPIVKQVYGLCCPNGNE